MKCFLIAKQLSHSFSKPIHNALGKYSYEYKELRENELAGFLKERDFDGLNVTIPYKTAVMEYLDYISPQALEIGAVNTVVKKEGKLWGYNTDYYGFAYMVKRAGINLQGKTVAIIGRGGAAKTVRSVCNKMGAEEILTITREDIAAGDMKRFVGAQVIVNATPVGMYPSTGKSPVCISSFPLCEAVLDLIYNPACTQIMLDAQKRGIKTENGLSMLVAQAKRACELFTGEAVAESEIEKIRLQIEKQTKNIVLIGMPGCGKTSVGKEIAKGLGREFFDCDEEIEKKGLSPAEIIKKYGEMHFREIESEMLGELCKKSRTVIATGGGAVTVEKNFDIIRQNAAVIFINRSVSKLATEGRPLSQGGIEKLQELSRVRMPLYKKFSDVETESLETYQKTAEKILKMIE